MKIYTLVSSSFLVLGASCLVSASPKPVKYTPSLHKPKVATKSKQALATSVPKVTDTMTPIQKLAAQSALKSLRKLGAAADVGVSLTDYQSRLIDTKSDVEENLRSVPDSKVKTMIEDTMQTYQDASTFWNECLQLKSRAKIADGASGAILTKYSLTLPKLGQKEIDLANELADKAKQDNAAAEDAMKDTNYNSGTVDGYLADAKQSLNDSLEAFVSAAEINDEDKQKILSAIWLIGSQKEEATDDTIK